MYVYIYIYIEQGVGRVHRGGRGSDEANLHASRCMLLCSRFNAGLFCLVSVGLFCLVSVGLFC
jgi:hypothetical protein